MCDLGLELPHPLLPIILPRTAVRLPNTSADLAYDRRIEQPGLSVRKQRVQQLVAADPLSMRELIAAR